MLSGLFIGYVFTCGGEMDWILAEHRLRRSGHLRIDHRCSSRASGSASFFCVLSFSQPMTPLTSRMKQNQLGDRKNHQAGGQASDQQRSKRHQRTRGKKTHTAHKHTHKVQGISARDERELPGRLPLTAPLIRHSIFSFSGSDVVLIWTRYRTGSCYSSFLPEAVEAAPTFAPLPSVFLLLLFSSSFCHSCNKSLLSLHSHVSELLHHLLQS